MVRCKPQRDGFLPTTPICKTYRSVVRKGGKSEKHLSPDLAGSSFLLITRKLNSEILAALTQDEGLLTAFSEGRDIHAATAAKIFDVAIDAVTREQRSTAKMVNFGIPYGISAFGLAQRLGNVSRTEAQAIIDSYFKQFPGIPDYMNQMKESAKTKGYVETITGRRRYLRDINSSNATIRASAERNAINMPIQGHCCRHDQNSHGQDSEFSRRAKA